MTQMIDSKENGSDQQMGEEGMRQVRSQLSHVLHEIGEEEVLTAHTEPQDDGLPDDGDGSGEK